MSVPCTCGAVMTALCTCGAVVMGVDRSGGLGLALGSWARRGATLVVSISSSCCPKEKSADPGTWFAEERPRARWTSRVPSRSSSEAEVLRVPPPVPEQSASAARAAADVVVVLSSSSFSQTAMNSASDARFSSCLHRSFSRSMCSRRTLTVAVSSSEASPPTMVLSNGGFAWLSFPPEAFGVTRGVSLPTSRGVRPVLMIFWTNVSCCTLGSETASLALRVLAHRSDSSCRGVNCVAVTSLQTMSALEPRAGCVSNTAPSVSDRACRPCSFWRNSRRGVTLSWARPAMRGP
mmetsp:Transcript_5091/g.11950  ORF Transcript_5091/g.11950 Transcript_5091/m.11950 type:complete len:292 (+) Transcript_5091:1261-2136(+)